MLEFFRKYQRFFFLLVTVVIVISFSFFGTYSTIGTFEREKEVVVGKAIDNSKLKFSEIDQLARLLNAEESIVEDYFLKNGFADMLFKAYFETLSDEFQARIYRASRYRFYEHPAASQLNARDLWRQFCPGFKEEMEKLQAVDSHSIEALKEWTNLYLVKKKCPEELIRRVLLYQQQHYRLPIDQRLGNEDLSLFGFRTLSDWFGRDAMELFAQFILNGSIVAKQHGCSVKREDAKADLEQRLQAPLELALRPLGVGKQEAIALWQKTLSFAQDMKSISHAALVDGLAIRRVEEFAAQKAKLEVCHLPQELCIKDVDDLLAFEVYTSLACKKPSALLALPEELEEIDLIEAQAPELVAKSYTFQAAEIDRKKIAARVSLKELWDWQIQDSSWKAMREVFADLKEGKRFEILEQLSPDRRMLVDAWCREQIVKEHPEWLEQELALLPMQQRVALFYSDGDSEGFACKDAAELQLLLEKAEPFFYQEEGRLVRIAEIEKGDKRALSLLEAKKKQRLPVERFMNERYKQIRTKTPSLFQDEEGQWKPLADVRDLVVAQLYKDLFAELRKWSADAEISQLARYRFYPLMSGCQEGKEVSFGLWNLMREERSVTRTSSEEWMMNQPFTQEIGNASPLHLATDGDIIFFSVKDRTVEPSPIFEQIFAAQERIATDVQRCLASKLLDVILKKEAIVLPIRKEGERHDDL